MTEFNSKEEGIIKLYKYFFPFTFLILLILNVTLPNYSLWISLFSGLLVVAHLFLVKKVAGNFDFWAFSAVSLLYLVLLVFWLIFDNLSLFITTTYSYLILVLLSLLFVFKNMRQQSLWWKRALSILYLIFMVVLLAGSSAVTYFSVEPGAITKQFQGVNSFEPQKVNSPKYDDNLYSHNVDIKYGTNYPNSFMDIISINDGEIHPVFFYAHGGGFSRGDKILAHPDNPSLNDFSFVSFNEILAQGFNVVTINYAFAPEYLYPVPIIQASEAMSFLLENGASYGLDMNNIVLSGESAGGYIVAALLSAQLSSEYATKIGLEPILQKELIKAMVLESAILDPRRAGKTEKTNIVFDYIFQMATTAFFETSAISADKEVLSSANLLSYINEDFPPTFITDGNSGTWPNQAQEYAKALQNEGVYSEVYVPGEETGKQGHVYFENVNNPSTTTYLDKRRDFLSDFI